MKPFEREVRRRRDQSLYVTHFTRAVNGLEPGEALRHILRERVVRASSVGGPGVDAVCLTEAPLLGLIVPTEPRSPAHGIGFAKKLVYERGGMPVIYLRHDLLGRSGTGELDAALRPFVKPFHVDEDNWTFEREWRVPRDLRFRHEDVAFVIVPRDERDSFAGEFPGIRRLLDYEFLLEAL